MNLPDNYLCLHHANQEALPIPPTTIIRCGGFWNIYHLTQPRTLAWPHVDYKKPDGTDDMRENEAIIHYSQAVHDEKILWEAFRANAFEKMCWQTPDPLGTELCAATLVGNMIPDGKIWTMLIGPASCGKTYTMDLFQSLESKRLIYYVGKLKAAAIWSALNFHNSILLKVDNGGSLVSCDGGSLLGHGKENFAKVMANLREVYDGKVVDNTALGQKKWIGKVGFIIATTMEMQRHRYYNTLFGDRFIYYVMHSYKWPWLAKPDMGQYIYEVVGERLSRITSILDIANPYLHHLRAFSRAMEILRTSNPLFHRKNRTYVVKPNAEHRLSHQLQTLAVAMALLEGEHQVTKKIMGKIAMVVYRSAISRYTYIVEPFFQYKLRKVSALKFAWPLDPHMFDIVLTDLQNFGLITYDGAQIGPSQEFEEIWNAY